MNYTLDCEFNGYKGELLSLALYNPERSLYLVDDYMLHQLREANALTPWVQANVIPQIAQLHDTRAAGLTSVGSRAKVRRELAHFLRSSSGATLHAEWPDDIKYFCELMITGPGERIDVPAFSFQLHWVDAYAGNEDAAQRHHAWYDARELYRKLF